MPQSESARATSAAESRYRVAAPNSLPRAVMVVALDADAATLAADLATRAWRGVTFFTAPATSAPDTSFSRWLNDITGQAVDVMEEVSRADVVQMLTVAGRDTPTASLIGEACAIKGVKASGLVIDSQGAGSDAQSRSLQALRPWVVTLSVIGSSTDVDEILRALGG